MAHGLDVGHAQAIVLRQDFAAPRTHVRQHAQGVERQNLDVAASVAHGSHAEDEGLRAAVRPGSERAVEPEHVADVDLGGIDAAEAFDGVTGRD